MKTNTTLETKPKQDINISSLETFKKDPKAFLSSLAPLERQCFFTSLSVKEVALNLKVALYNPSSLLSLLLDNMMVEDIALFFDASFLECIDKHPYRRIILTSILLSHNDFLSISLKDTDYLPYIVNHLDEVNGLIDDMSFTWAKNLFDYISSSSSKEIIKIKYLGEQAQIEVIKNIGIYEFYRLTQDLNIFDYLSNTAISFLIRKEPFTSYFANLPLDDILRLIDSSVIIPDSLSFNSLFIEKISTIPDINKYRMVLERVLTSPYEQSSYVNLTHRYNALVYLSDNGYDTYDELLKVKDALKEIPPTFNPEKLEQKRDRYDDTCVDALELSSFSEVSLAQILGPILIDRYFKDIPYNFLANLKMMMQFYDAYSFDAIPLSKEDLTSFKKRLEIYYHIINLPHMKKEDQVSFYHSLALAPDLVLSFYDDYQMAKELAYQDMNQKTLRLDLLIPRIEGDVSIYDLKGEEFYLYVHVTREERGDEDALHPFNQSHRFFNDAIDAHIPPGHSLSLVSSKKLTTIRPVRKYVAYGFNYLDPKRIAHIYHADSYSIYSHHSTGTYKINDIYLAAHLIENTRRYNEILYQEVNDSIFDPAVYKRYPFLEPSCLYCYDVITPFDLMIAKKLSLPIVLVHTKFYQMEAEEYNDYNYDNEYLHNYGDTSKQYIYE